MIQSIHQTGRRPFRIGAVRYYNTLPLIYGLDAHPEVELTRLAPAELAEALEQNRFNVGLVPSIDFQHTEGDWLILPVGAIVSQGEVLTVRVFSRRPPAQVRTLAADTESHTSVALARVLWRLCFDIQLEIRPLSGPPDEQEAVLLIGDKVIAQLDRWSWEFDLGAAWTDKTHLPFVYAFWALPADAGVDRDRLVEILGQARRQGQEHLETIIAGDASRHGFSVELARRYFEHHIQHDLGATQIEGLQRFYRHARDLGIVGRNRPLAFYPAEGSRAVKQHLT
ncbi:MAG: menaquinone biosynthesis protein [Sedimentisphaerales bacterium]|nr:menaquinone biosynthesis protein [Sedimentisphaerales bacterium]